MCHNAAAAPARGAGRLCYTRRAVVLCDRMRTDPAPAAVLTLTLFVPGLIPADEAHARVAAQPTLYRWLCRGRQEIVDAVDADAALGAWFGLAGSEELAHAALSALGSGIDPREAVWLHADPVHFHAQRTELVLVDAARLAIDAAESHALVDALNAHFSHDAIRLHALSPTCWIAESRTPVRLRTVPLSVAAGRNVDALLPAGTDALAWHRRSNEAQMLLHAHPVNQEREARGAPALNSVWWWGVGALPVCTRAFDAVWGEDAFLRGLARRTGAPAHPLPADATAWLREARRGAHLVALRPSASADPADLTALEQAWFAPIARALAQGRIDSATLATCAHGRRVAWRLTRADRWKLWRRNPRLPRRAPGHVHA